MEPIEDDSREADQRSDTPADSDAEDPSQTLGRVIREGRKGKGLTQERAAQRLQISLRNFIRAEQGQNVTFKMFLTILRGLDLSPFEIAGYVIGPKEEVVVAPKGKKRTRVPPNQRNEFPLRSKAKSKGVEALEVSRRDPRTVPVRLHAEIRDRRIVTLGDGAVVMLPEDVPQGGTIEVRVTGEDYLRAGIGDGDLLTVARSGKAAPKPGALIIAIVGGEVVIGRYRQENGRRLIVADGDGSVTVLADSDQIYGVITTLVRNFNQP